MSSTIPISLTKPIPSEFLPLSPLPGFYLPLLRFSSHLISPFKLVLAVDSPWLCFPHFPVPVSLFCALRWSLWSGLSVSQKSSLVVVVVVRSYVELLDLMVGRWDVGAGVAVALCSTVG